MKPTLAELEKFKTELAQFNADSFIVKDKLKAPTTFIKDGTLFLSTEDGELFADFYGAYRDGNDWIDPRLVAWAAEKGAFWEWKNPSCVALNLGDA